MNNIPSMAKKDMDEIKQFIRDVGEELAAKIQTSKMEEIAKAHVHAGIKDVLGIDASIMGEVRDIRANMNFVRSFRRLSEKVGMAMILTVATILTGGVIAVIVKGLK